MSTSRPEWMKCVRHPREDKRGFTLCGRMIESFEFAFEGIDHAYCTILNGDSLQACAKCVRVASDVLLSGCGKG